MTEKPILLQPFDLSIKPWGDRFFAIVLLITAITAGFTGFLHFQGFFQLPTELSILPFDALCGGIALVFFFLGLTRFFRFRGYRVDPDKQTIQGITKSIFGTRYGKKILFSELTYVQIDRKKIGNHDERKYIYYPVYISLKNDAPEQVFSSDRYLASRVCAERIAKLAMVNLHDDSEPGATQVRKPEELDQTVRDKLQKTFSDRSSPSVPLRMHAKLQLRFEMLTIEIPRFNIKSLGAMKKILWIFFAIFGVWTAIALYYQEYFFAFFGTLFFIIMLWTVLRTETIMLTRDTFSIRSGVGFFKRTQRILLSEMEELCLSNVTKSETDESEKLLEEGHISKNMHGALETLIALGSSILARSDHKSISFGRVLTHAELDYILYQIERWIR